jgi:hypothetical protein
MGVTVGSKSKYQVCIAASFQCFETSPTAMAMATKTLVVAAADLAVCFLNHFLEFKDVVKASQG